MKEVFSSDYVFAALKEDGSVITWGSGDPADSSSVSSDLQSGVTKIHAGTRAFAAFKAE